MKNLSQKQLGSSRYPHSANLFKFTHMVLSHQKEGRVNNKDIGLILDFKPSDCSHWKRGTKNIKTVTDLNKIAEYLNVDNALIYDMASGEMGFEEACFEWMETQGILELPDILAEIPRRQLVASHKKILDFVNALHKQAQFSSPPLFLPEAMRYFPYISTQPTTLTDKLTRIHRVRSTHYRIQYKQGTLTPQARLSMAKDLARIVLDTERVRYPELGEYSENTIEYEKLLFASELLCPKFLLAKELPQLDHSLNLNSEISKLFWVPKYLANYQLRGLLHDKFIASKPYSSIESKSSDQSSS